MTSEWLKVMLEEITRKKSAAAEAQAELERRGGVPDGPSTNAPAPDGAAPGETSVPRRPPGTRRPAGR